MTTVGITGHRPERLENPEWVKSALSNTLQSLGATSVLQGMADGVDMWAAAAAWRLQIPFIAVRPWRGHTQNQVAEGYAWCLRNASETVEISTSTEYPGAQVYHQRNHWIVDHSDILVAVWDGVRKGGAWQTVKYARSVDHIVVHLNPSSMIISGLMSSETEEDPTLL